MARVIDIEDLVSLDKVIIKAGGDSYRLPDDLLVPDYLRLRALFNQLVDADADSEDFDANETLSELHDELLAMFQVHQPDLTELPFGPRSIVPVVYAYLNQEIGEQQEDAPPPPRRASTRTKPSGGRQKTPTRSRRKTSTG
jgi:hypothetical protein